MLSNKVLLCHSAALRTSIEEMSHVPAMPDVKTARSGFSNSGSKDSCFLPAMISLSHQLQTHSYVRRNDYQFYTLSSIKLLLRSTSNNLLVVKALVYFQFL